MQMHGGTLTDIAVHGIDLVQWVTVGFGLIVVSQTEAPNILV